MSTRLCRLRFPDILDPTTYNKPQLRLLHFPNAAAYASPNSNAYAFLNSAAGTFPSMSSNSVTYASLTPPYSAGKVTHVASKHFPWHFPNITVYASNSNSYASSDSAVDASSTCPQTCPPTLSTQQQLPDAAYAITAHAASGNNFSPQTYPSYSFSSKIIAQMMAMYCFQREKDNRSTGDRSGDNYIQKIFAAVYENYWLPVVLTPRKIRMSD